MLLLIAATLALLLATTAHAHAEPITLALFGAVFAASIPGQVVSFLITAAFSIGTSLLKRAMRGDQPPQGVKLEVEVGDESPIGFVVGQYATAGTRKYIGTWGHVGKTPNAYVTDVIQVGDRPALGQPSHIWVNGKRYEIDWEAAPTEQGYPVKGFDRDGWQFLWVWYLDGTQTTANAFLLDKFGDHLDRPWEADMIGRGCPIFIVTALFDRQFFPGQVRWLFEPPAQHFYDLRKDSTAGGVGDHRRNDQSTWGPTENPAVIAYNVAMGIYYDDGAGYREWLFGGQDLPAFRLPAANWMAAMNECDVEIPVAYAPGGSVGVTEKQFRCGYEIRGDQEPLAVIEELLRACAGRMAENGGIFKVLIGAPGAAVYSFNDGDVVVTKGQSYRPFPGLAETYNAIEATYPEPAEAWAMKDAPARYSSALEEADGDRRLATGIQYQAVPHGTQVQRLMKAAIEEERRFRVHSFYLPPDAWVLEPNDVVSWTSVRNGYTNKKFLVVRITGEPTVNQLVVLKEIDPTDYDWDPDTDESPIIVGPIGPLPPPIQDATGFQVFPDTINDNAGNPRRPTWGVLFDGDMSDVQFVGFEVKLAGAADDDLIVTGDIPYGDPATNEDPKYVRNANVYPPATNLEVRFKYRPYSARRTNWSLWLPVTTPDVRLGSDDIWPEELVDDLIEDLGPMIDFMGPGLRDVIDEARRLTASFVDFEAGAYRDRKQIRQSINSTFESSKAYADLAIDVATGPGSAIAQTLLDLGAEIEGKADSSVVLLLQATVDEIDGEVEANSNAILALESGYGDATANANLRFSTSAGPAGYASRIGLEARTGGAGAYRLASLFLDVPASALDPTRIVLLAEQVAIMTSAGTVAALFNGDTTYLNNARIIGLTAANINVVELLASTAFVENLHITDSLQLDPGVVIEGTIAANAVTSSDSDSASGVEVENSYSTLASITISSPSGNPIMLYSAASITGGTSGGDTIDVRVMIGGTILRTANAAGSGVTASLPGELRMVAVSPGTHTITIQGRSTSGTLNTSATLIGQCNKK